MLLGYRGAFSEAPCPGSRSPRRADLAERLIQQGDENCANGIEQQFQHICFPSFLKNEQTPETAQEQIRRGFRGSMEIICG